MNPQKPPNYLSLSETQLASKFKSLFYKKEVTVVDEVERNSILDEFEGSSISSSDKLNEQSFISDITVLDQSHLNMSMSMNYGHDLETSFIMDNVSKPFNFIMSKLPKKMSFKEDDDFLSAYKENVYKVL